MSGRNRPVIYHAVSHSVFFAFYLFVLVVGLGALSYFVPWMELKLPFEDSLIILSILGLALGFMRGLGTGYAFNPDRPHKHIVIFASALLITATLLTALLFVYSPDQLTLSRDGALGFVLGLAFFGSLMILLAYTQMREVKRKLRHEN